MLWREKGHPQTGGLDLLVGRISEGGMGVRRYKMAMALLALSIAVSGCTLGSRRVVTETRDVADFDEVVLEGIGELTIIQGEQESITIEAESNVIDRITTEVRGGTLFIGMRSSGFGLGVIPTRGVHYELTVSDLHGLELTGVGSIQVPALRTETLDVNIHGAGAVRIRSLIADRLVVEHTSVGACEIEGQVDRQIVDLTGAGNYDAADLETERTDVTVSGVGKATVWANDTLDVKITGAGSVAYYGDPELTERVTGVGSVKGLGER